MFLLWNIDPCDLRGCVKLYLRFSARPVRFMRRLFLSRLFFNTKYCQCSRNDVPRPRRVRLRFRAELESGATIASADATTVEALALPESPQAEIPQCRAANSSTLDFPPAVELLPLPTGRRSGCAISALVNLSFVVRFRLWRRFE